jgi:hypothetical protein
MDPYIRKTMQLDGGRFMILCMSKSQSAFLMSSREVQVDMTFNRTQYKEFEVNGFDDRAKRIGTMARVFTNAEDGETYSQLFHLIFDQAESDMGYRIPFGHIIPLDEQSPSKTRVKAILVDESAGQMKGLMKYFKSKFPGDDPLTDHVLKIVKTCQVHYKRTIQKAQRQGGNDGTLLLALLLMLDLCHLLEELPNITDQEQFNDLYKYVQMEAHKLKDKVLLDWLRHKESNPWILNCVSPAVSTMAKDDWYTTSMNTNNAETMHAHSKRSCYGPIVGVWVPTLFSCRC